jgi:hypothetical protein
MWRFTSLALLFLAACGSSSNGSNPPGDATPTHDGTLSDARVVDAPKAPGDGRNPSPDAAPSSNSFRFGIVGDTRPAVINDTSAYPTAVITTIWNDIEAESPALDFAVSTGDYMFASTTSGQALPQLTKYLTARSVFHNPVYAAMGNHECTGATTSNCGAGTTDGVTDNYTQFMSHMVTPQGQSEPYYAVFFHAADNSWTAKLVLVAGNAWTSAQGSWLTSTLAMPTTYTFVVRHESDTATTAPGVSPSKAIINAHPVTLQIVGHAHTYQHASTHEVIDGTGGAPLTSGSNYGYGVIERLANGDVQFTQKDYQSHAVIDQWRVHADGTSAP